MSPRANDIYCWASLTLIYAMTGMEALKWGRVSSTKALLKPVLYFYEEYSATLFLCQLFEQAVFRLHNPNLARTDMAHVFWRYNDVSRWEQVLPERKLQCALLFHEMWVISMQIFLPAQLLERLSLQSSSLDPVQCQLRGLVRDNVLDNCSLRFSRRGEVLVLTDCDGTVWYFVNLKARFSCHVGLEISISIQYNNLALRSYKQRVHELTHLHSHPIMGHAGHAKPMKALWMKT